MHLSFSKIKTLGIALAASAALGACSDIATDERFIEMDEIVPQRTIIIEDFTGQDCRNCPAAHDVLHKLVEQYGDYVIPVAIHAGGFGVPVEYSYYPDFVFLMQPEGNTYNDHYNIKQWPMGVVNRRSGAIDPDKWSDAARNELTRLPEVNISLSASYDPVTEKISINTTLMPVSDTKGKLQLWVLEDGIVAEQQLETERISDYVHNHVYRASVNGIWGEDVTLSGDKNLEFSHEIQRRDSETEVWNADNLYVVAFVYNDSGVLQATRAHVTR